MLTISKTSLHFSVEDQGQGDICIFRGAFITFSDCLGLLVFRLLKNLVIQLVHDVLICYIIEGQRIIEVISNLVIQLVHDVLICYIIEGQRIIEVIS